MDTNQNDNNNTSRGGHSDQSEKEHSEDRGDGIANQRAELKQILLDIGELSAALQYGFNSLAITVPEIEESVKEFINMPEQQAMKKISSVIMEVIKIVPYAHAIKVNLFVTLLASLANATNSAEIVDIIEEINNETLYS